MKTFPIFKTKRLILKPISIKDAPQIQEKFPHWEIVKFLNASNVPWPYPENGAKFFIENFGIPNMESGDILTWSIFLKEKPEILIGSICLMNNEDENRGFWIDTNHQGKGYITEASDIVTDYWFFELNKDKLIVPKSINNIASKRISEKQGMRCIGNKIKDYVIGPCETDIWEISKEEWFKYRSGKI